MKKLIILFMVGLLAPRITHAQGTITYLSNLGQTSAGSNPVGSNSWLTEDFITGNNAGGYLLDSVQLGMVDASGNPSGFTVMIYSAIIGAGINPGSSLGTLNGSMNPVTSGTYTYTPASTLTLQPSTFYFIVLIAGTTIANGAYQWDYLNTSSYNPSDGWSGGITFNSSNGSSPWIRLGANPYDYSQFSITATAVPEPSPSLLLLLGGGMFIYVRRAFRR